MQSITFQNIWMLTINNLTVSYGKKTVLSDLSFEAMPGMVHGIVGYNGAGKTDTHDYDMWTINEEI